MDRLTLKQIEALRDTIGPKHGYLIRLRERMEKVGFNPPDKLYQLVRAAEESMHSLWVELHYRSCGHGVGRPPESK